MTVKRIVTIQQFVGLSSDTKPAGVLIGSEFLEYDTSTVYRTYDGTNWTRLWDVGPDKIDVDD